MTVKIAAFEVLNKCARQLALWRNVHLENFVGLVADH